ncbi:hypothetical protein PFNF54_02998, partial [Plasmodium falciparum NF54]
MKNCRNILIEKIYFLLAILGTLSVVSLYLYIPNENINLSFHKYDSYIRILCEKHPDDNQFSGSLCRSDCNSNYNKDIERESDKKKNIILENMGQNGMNKTKEHHMNLTTPLVKYEEIQNQDREKDDQNERQKRERKEMEEREERERNERKKREEHERNEREKQENKERKEREKQERKEREE